MGLHRQLTLEIRTVAASTGATIVLEGENGLSIRSAVGGLTETVVVHGTEEELRQYLAGFGRGVAHGLQQQQRRR